MFLDVFDKIVCVEILNKNGNPHLYDAVVKHMMHGPYGTLDPTNVCMNKQEKWKNEYPKSLWSNIVIGKK